jgi:hypothetical protein
MTNAALSKIRFAWRFSSSTTGQNSNLSTTAFSRMVRRWPSMLLSVTNEAQAYKSIRSRTSISGHPLSQQAVDWTLALLEQCKAKHEACQQTARPLLPKRVILLHTNGSAQITARLFEPINQRGSYVALSHCWGKHQKCITTKSTISARKAGIPWKKVPKTFQEVIHFAVRLGFRFIWIDSLCEQLPMYNLLMRHTLTSYIVVQVLFKTMLRIGKSSLHSCQRSIKTQDSRLLPLLPLETMKVAAQGTCTLRQPSR